MPPLFLALTLVQELTAIVIPVVIFALAAVIALTAMYYHHRREALWHETARVALEKGQKLPPRPGEEALRQEQLQKHGATPATDLRAGLVLVATGIGLYLFLGAFLGRGLAFVGAIPFCIGIAMIIYALGSLLFARKNPPQDPPSRS